MTLFLTQPHSKTSSTAFSVKAKSPHVSYHQIPCQTKWQKILWQYKLCNEKKQTYTKQQIKPGLSLYKSLLRGQQLQKIELKINIPETLMRDQQQNIYIIYTQKDRVKKKKATVQQYDMLIKKANQEIYQKHINNRLKMTKLHENKPQNGYRFYIDYTKNQYTPFVLTKYPDEQDQTLFEKQLYTYKRYIQEKCKPSRNKVIQRYVMSRNLKALLFRFCYHSKSNGSLAQNFAYRVQNNNPIYKFFKRTQTYESTINLSTIVVNEDKQHTFQFTKIVGKSLKQFEVMAQSLTNFLQKSYSIRIKKIYIDFMIDINEIIWVVNLKYIQFDNSIQLSKLNLDSELLTCTAYCKLCGMIYKRDEVSKNLTYKLLYQLVQHLKKRTRIEDNANKFLHELKFNININKPCQLCNLCYMLVVSEHELIQVQKTLAKMVNIKVKEEIKIDISDPKSKKRPAYLPQNLKQWRLMLYFSQINQFCNNDKNLYLQYKINNLIYLSESLKITQNHSKTVQLNQIKLHYFFSVTLDIEKFLNQSQILIRITQGPDWNKCIAEGSSGTISHFKNKVAIQSGQRHSSTILLFFQDSKFCQVLLTVGLVCDGTYNTSEINLYKQKQVYLTENTYHNVNPLPKEWMQMFSPKYALKMMDTTKICNYTPLSTYDEIKKMIGIQNLKKEYKK